MLVLNTYIGHQFPSQAQRGLRNAAKAIDHLLTAHVLGYNAIHAIYREAGWLPPLVTINNYCSDLYWCDKLLTARPARLAGKTGRSHGDKHSYS
jgi:hypothetical protein